MSMPSFSIVVPATTANIGSGFDCLGAALSLHNTFTFSPLDGSVPLIIMAAGDEADRVQLTSSNLAYQAFSKLFQHVGKPVPPVQIEIELQVPLARGLGSSATAIVGGLLGANGLAGSPLSQSEILQLAIALEGHPDNVAPALLGGCRLAVADSSGWQICDISWHEAIVPIAAIPNFELSTAEARRVLPLQYSRSDAIFNAAHLGLLIRGLETGHKDWLRAALHDRIHQPYRQPLIPGYEAVYDAALQAGAYGLVISGAGSTLLALTEADTATPVQAAIAQAWKTAGIDCTVKILAIDHRGAKTS
jgi:homoserine kinase